jgi:hypothetical protein
MAERKGEERRRGRRYRINNKMAWPTHSDPCGDQVHLVQDIHQMLVRLLLPQVLDDRLTPGAERVTSVQHMDDDIGRVEHLVQLSPNSAGGTLVVNGFTDEGDGVVVGVGGGCFVVPGQTERVLAIGDDGRLTELFQRAEIETWSLPLGFGAEGVGIGLGLDNVWALKISFSIPRCERW